MSLFTIFSRAFPRRPTVIVGLDAGTRAIKIAVGEAHPSGRVTMVGSHSSPSEGFRKGEVVDQEAASRSIIAAITEAEEALNITIGEVEMSATGAHLQSVNVHGSLSLRPERPHVTDDDVEEVIMGARRAVNLSDGRVLLQSIRRQFFLDGGPALIQPVDQSASLLEVDLHCIHGIRTRFDNLTDCLHLAPDAPLEVAGSVFSGLASALAVLDPQDKKLGAIVLDIGAGVTDYAVYAGGRIRQSGALAVGGEHLVNDVQVGLKLKSSRRAEALIREAGRVWPREPRSDHQIVIRTSELLEEKERSVPLWHLHEVMFHRVDEILRLVHERIDMQGMDDLAGGTVFLTGGCSRIHGLPELAASVFGMEAKRAAPCGFDGVTDHLRMPEMATAVGLVKYRAVAGTDGEEARGPWAYAVRALSNVLGGG